MQGNAKLQGKAIIESLLHEVLEDKKYEDRINIDFVESM